MTEEKNNPEMNGGVEEVRAEPAPAPEEPTVPKPCDRSPEVDRKIRSAVEKMFEDVLNPYETVVIAAQEARRINDRRLKARSILNQAMEQAEELLPEVPFVPHPVEDEEPEVKATNEAVEKLAVGLVTYEIDDGVQASKSYYPGEIDFPLYAEEDDEEKKTEEP